MIEGQVHIVHISTPLVVFILGFTFVFICLNLSLNERRRKK